MMGNKKGRNATLIQALAVLIALLTLGLYTASGTEEQNVSCEFFTPADPERDLTRNLRRISWQTVRHVMNYTHAALVNSGIGDITNFSSAEREVGILFSLQPLAREGERRLFEDPLYAECKTRIRCASGKPASHQMTLGPVQIYTLGPDITEILYGCTSADTFTLLSTLLIWPVDWGLWQRAPLHLVSSEEEILRARMRSGPYGGSCHALLAVPSPRAVPRSLTTQHDTTALVVLFLQTLTSARLVLLTRDPPAFGQSQKPLFSPPSLIPVQAAAPWLLPLRTQAGDGAATAGCLSSDSNIGAVVYTDPARHTSRLQIFALPYSTDASSPVSAVLLLESSSTSVGTADASLLASCGLAQRVLFTRCQVRSDRPEWSSAGTHDVKVEVEAVVAAPVSDGVWHACGTQRYSSTVRVMSGRTTDVASALERVSSACATLASSSCNTSDAGCLRGRGAHRGTLVSPADSLAVEIAQDDLLHTGSRAGEKLQAGESWGCRRLHGAWWTSHTSHVSTWTCAFFFLTWQELAALYALVFLTVFAFQSVVLLLRRREEEAATATAPVIPFYSDSQN